MNLSVVIPVYRSSEILPRLIEELISSIPSNIDYEVILVNDCSPDNSWQVIMELSRTNQNIIGLNLRKNSGQHNAIMAGLRESIGQIVLMMDDDLQHPPQKIPDFIKEIESGYDVCYSRFNKLQQKYWKVFGSKFNGFVANILLDKPNNLYLSPYKAISGDIRDLIIGYDGPYSYIDGLILSYTDSISVIDIEHQERAMGEGNYSLRKSLSLWVMMATGFSVKPLRFATLFGFVISFVSFMLILGLLIFKFFYDINIQGWASLATIGLFMGGVQLIALGVIGEYVGRCYLKVNGKPQASVKENTRKHHG